MSCRHYYSETTKTKRKKTAKKNYKKNKNKKQKKEQKEQKYLQEDDQYVACKYLIGNLENYQRQILKNIFDVEILIRTMEASSMEFGNRNSPAFFIASLLDNLTVEDTDQLNSMIAHLENILEKRKKRNRKK